MVAQVLYSAIRAMEFGLGERLSPLECGEQEFLTMKRKRGGSECTPGLRRARLSVREVELLLLGMVKALYNLSLILLRCGGTDRDGAS